MKNNPPSGKTVLLLGNGFDLHCRLPTKYADFFAYRMKSRAYQMAYAWISQFPITEIDTPYCIGTTRFDFREGAPKLTDDLTLWDLLFIAIHYIKSSLLPSTGKKGPDFENWADVEEQIADSLSFLEGGFVSKTHVSISWRAVYNVLFDNSAQYAEEDHVTEMKTTCFENILSDVVSAQQPFPFSGNRLEDFYDYLLSQLRLFEKTFRQYIVDVLARHPTYQNKAERLCQNLLKQRPDPLIENFNYTSFPSRPISMLNIHGSIRGKSPIVFGIDDSGVEHDDPAYPFTKIMREIELGVDGCKSLPLDAHVSTAIIYGLSLTKEDYSFFADLFDRMQLFDLRGKSQLILCYSTYPGKSAGEIKQDLRYSLAALINRYSEARSQRCILLASLWHSGRLSFRKI